MNISERAEQLAHLHIFRATELPEIVGSDNCGKCGLNIRDKVHLRSGETVETTILAALASERELGVAAGLEKAAQECDRHAQFCKDEAHKGGDFQHLITRHSEAEYNTQRIRSLIPAEVLREQAEQRGMDVIVKVLKFYTHHWDNCAGGDEPCSCGLTQLRAEALKELSLTADSANLARAVAIEQAAQACKGEEIQELERRARLDEAKWWNRDEFVFDRSDRATDERENRIAALAESQPASATEDK